MNLYDVLAGQGTSHFERLFYQQFGGGGKMQTLTGVPPLSFKANGTPLISLSMLGNTQQQGTPSHDNIIMPDFCGVRTAQIIDYTLSESGGIDSSGNPVVSSNLWRSNVFYEIHGSIVISFVPYSTLLAVRVNYYDTNYTHISREQFYTNAASGASLTIPSDAKYFKWTLYTSTGAIVNIDFVRQCYIMLNSGSTALPYEPYGYKIPITCAGQTVPVYLGQTPTVRRIKKLVLTGEEAWQLWNGNYYSSVIDRKVAISTVLCTHFINSSVEGISYNGQSTSGLKIASVAVPFVSSVKDLKAWLAAQYAAGTPVTVWYVLAEPETAIVNEPLAKIGDYADELHSIDAAITIPTTKGNNTLTVDTDLQPSSMTITYKS